MLLKCSELEKETLYSIKEKYFERHREQKIDLYSEG